MKKNDRQVIINSNLLEIIDYTPYIDWEQRRYEIAKAAIQGACNDYSYLPTDTAIQHNIAVYAVDLADALIEELKQNAQ